MTDESAPRGTWDEELRSTYSRLHEAIGAQDKPLAVKLIEQFDYECATLNYGFYAQWHADTERFLLRNGVTEDDLEGIRGDLKLLVNTPWNPGVPYDRAEEIVRYRILKARLLRELAAPVSVTLATLAEWKELWRSIHDRDVDFASGLVNAAYVRFGETSIEDLYRFVIEERFNFRYAQFDVSKTPWPEAFERLVTVSIHAQRGHLVGPERDGTPELVEFDDRVELSFAPCGTGGRTVAGDRVSGTPSRHLAPFYFNSIREKHDFAWNKTGVCLYCAHCAMLVQKLPMERFGYPLRVVEPPTFPDNAGKCTWKMYRDLRAIPESAYAQMGERKPGPDEPLGSAGRQPAKGQ